MAQSRDTSSHKEQSHCLFDLTCLRIVFKRRFQKHFIHHLHNVCYDVKQTSLPEPKYPMIFELARMTCVHSSALATIAFRDSRDSPNLNASCCLFRTFVLLRVYYDPLVDQEENGSKPPSRNRGRFGSFGTVCHLVFGFWMNLSNSSVVAFGFSWRRCRIRR